MQHSREGAASSFHTNDVLGTACVVACADLRVLCGAVHCAVALLRPLPWGGGVVCRCAEGRACSVLQAPAAGQGEPELR